MSKSIAGMANTNAKEVKKIALPLPPVDLQNRFAAHLQAIQRIKRASKAGLAEADAVCASLQHRPFLEDM